VVTYFKGGGGHEPRNVTFSRSCRRQGKGVSSGASRRNQPCAYLALAQRVWFQVSDLQDYRITNGSCVKTSQWFVTVISCDSLGLPLFTHHFQARNKMVPPGCSSLGKIQWKEEQPLYVIPKSQTPSWETVANFF
jgi:hypothetical protein